MLDPTVLELLASRICHDLISPVGAVHNGVEFLQEMGAEAGGEAIDLIAHSAETAAAKLQIFRLAYGAGGRDPNIKPEDIHRTFESLIKMDGKITHDWDPHDDLGFDERPDGYCKILMGALMLAQECLPKGGTIAVTAADMAGVNLITATGDDAALRSDFDTAMDGNLAPDNLDPRLVHPYALGVLAQHYNLDLKIAGQENGKVSFTLSVRV